MRTNKMNGKSKSKAIPKEYSFKERLKIEKDCRKMVERLNSAMYKFAPEKYYALFWDAIWLLDGNLMTVDGERIKLLQEILVDAPKHIKQLQTK